MKKGKLALGKKLFLNKERIAILSKDQSANVLGGCETGPSNCQQCYDTKGNYCRTQDCVETCAADCEVSADGNCASLMEVTRCGDECGGDNTRDTEHWLCASNDTNCVSRLEVCR